MKTLITFAWLSTISSAVAEPRRVWVQYADNQRANCLQSLQNSIAKSLSKSLTIATPSSLSSSTASFNQTIGTNLPLEMNFDFPEHNAIVVTAHDEQALLDLQAAPSVVNVMDDPKRYPRYIADSLKRVNLDETTNRESRLRGPRELLSYSDTVPYGVSMVEAPSVWQSGYLGSGVTVCMIDTGLDTTNPDISPSSRYTGWDFGNGGKSSSSGWSIDPVGHGTHTSGTVSAAMNNAGIVGVAPSADVMMVRIFNNQGNYVFSSALVDAVRRCRKNSKVKVISMSLGGPYPNAIEAQAFQNAFNANIVNVAAAGNGGNSVLDYPASYNGVISVAAIDQNKQVASFSQRNSKVDICAPGVNVLSTLPMSPYCQICMQYGVTEYGELSGTSMSTPHVSGVAALLFSYNMSASAATITNAITSTAEDLGAKGKDDLYGYGLVQAGKALAAMSRGIITNPPTQSPVYSSPAPTPSFGLGSGASSCSSGETNVTLLILADNLPEQIEYEFIRESDQHVVWKNGGVVGYGQIYEDSKCLATPSQCYNFSIAVAGGDGYVNTCLRFICQSFILPLSDSLSGLTFTLCCFAQSLLSVWPGRVCRLCRRSIGRFQRKFWIF